MIKTTSMVPFSEVEPLLNQIKDATGASTMEIMHTIGYNSNGLDNKWKLAGKAPRRIKYALAGMLNDLNIKLVEPSKEPMLQLTTTVVENPTTLDQRVVDVEQEPVHTQELTYKEIVYLIALVGVAQSAESQRAVLRKLAQMLIEAK